MRLLGILTITLLLLATSSLAPVLAQPGGTATPASESEAQALLRKASERLAETETVRFNLEVEGDTYIDEEQDIRLINARGNLARPDSVDVEFQVELLGTQTVSIRMISIGDESWTTDLLTGEWAPSPEEFGYNPTVLFDNQKGLGPVAGRLVDPEIVDKVEIGGREAWKVVGTVDEEVIEPITSGTMEGEEITVTLWLDTETYDMLRIRVEEPKDIAKENPATWVLSLTGHDSDLTIQRPDIDE
ncbi:MAG TPA: LppX_LprAFG lipoprotein [Thermomicrobiales bacterium]|nr:LppX_LprAFG lipoprotein [Thermomicrobiales bacterium]